MKTIAILGDKGGTTKTASSHLICLGAYLSGVPAAYALTDPKRKVRGQGRPYAVLDGRLPEQLALILNSSRSNLNGWLVIDGGGNRPEFDIEVSKHVGLTILPFRASEEDIDTAAAIFGGNAKGTRLAERLAYQCLCRTSRPVFDRWSHARLSGANPPASHPLCKFDFRFADR